MKVKNLKNLIFKISIIAVILTAGWFAVFNIPDAVESFLPVVETVKMTEAQYFQTVCGSGIIAHITESASEEQGWYVSIAISESDIRKVEIGQTAALSGAAFDDGIYTATVCEIDSQAVNRQTDYARETVIEVVLKIDNPYEVVISGNSGTSGESGGILRPGYSVRAEIKTDETRTIHIIPYNTILQDDAQEYVYILSGNSAVRRNIITGAELSDGVEVVAGLRERDLIILSPESLAENALVNPMQD